MDELVFLVATAVIENIPQLKKIFKFYPKHFDHKNSHHAGTKTKQFPLGLFDCNETKTTELIKLLKELQAKYVPCNDEQIVEPVFFGGDRLTDERFQAAQLAMLNGGTSAERLEGFISKIEDFHRLMNFLEAICKLTYSTESGRDRVSAYYFRNVLNARNVKGDVRNHYRAYKLLYYTILDAMCCLSFLNEFGLSDFEEVIQFPENFALYSENEKISWMNEICRSLLRKHFFDSDTDIFRQLREILADPSHPENYWTSHLEDGRVKCHFCDKTYAYVGSLKVHEEKIHNAEIPQTKAKSKSQTDEDQFRNYCLLLVKLALLHKNLDTAVDMADGERSVRSAKYELPIYNITNKTKYAIGSIHLISLTESTCILNKDQKDRLTANRFINLQGGKNNNMALDEYVELLNRESKDMLSGFQTKESILAHSKEFPHIINYVQHYDDFCAVSKRKGFHHLPSYSEDVRKVAVELADTGAFSCERGRQLRCKALSADERFYDSSFRGLGTLIHRHKPIVAYHRLRNKRI
ncbi:uncharacterized protein LOC110443113 [Mizuhopecten yessoensis]|uniref:uncharacterized protein LOC110443113 n=1 Tax=Mizuhopecten yessoensis TaxID=6573 RepID=UPI000B458705|nr:uncharacterized protein LOC110443113 [Mizuhopecten yessoensis]